MKITSSYKVKLLSDSAALMAAVEIYRRAAAFLIEVVDAEWDTLQPIYEKSAKLGLSEVESLVHQTKGNPTPKYEFDKQFYKFPSYFRRAVINTALGPCHPIGLNWPTGRRPGAQSVSQS